MTILTKEQRSEIQAEHDEMVEYARINNYSLDRNQTIRGALLASEKALHEQLEAVLDAEIPWEYGMMKLRYTAVVKQVLNDV